MNRTLPALVAVTFLALIPAADVLAIESDSPSATPATLNDVKPNTAPKPTTAAPTVKEAQHAYDTGNYEEAFIIIEPLAKLNHPDAQYLLGQMYELGRGVKQDTEQAITLFTAAASQGYAAAEAKLGQMHLDSKQDYTSAMSWFQKAADHGYALAYGAIGDLYAKGYGVDKSPDKAIDFYTKAASGGDAESCFKLGELYEKESQPDMKQALFWYKKGAELGNKACQDALKRLEDK